MGDDDMQHGERRLPPNGTADASEVAVEIDLDRRYRHWKHEIAVANSILYFALRTSIYVLNVCTTA